MAGETFAFDNNMQWPNKRIFWSGERIQVWFDSVSLFVPCIAEHLPSSTQTAWQTNSIAHWFSTVKVGRDEFVCQRLISLSLWTETLINLHRLNVVDVLADLTQEKVSECAYRKGENMSHQPHCDQGKAEQNKTTNLCGHFIVPVLPPTSLTWDRQDFTTS